jgi:PIN domain nuclease of toxin-antitoxin system
VPPVLDASALLAYLRDEPGADDVADAIAAGAVVSTVNLAEIYGTVAFWGLEPEQLEAELTARGLLEGAIAVEPFTPADAIDVGRLRPLTRTAGLSLADRACLALARRTGARVLTADTAWTNVAVGVEIRLIR